MNRFKFVLLIVILAILSTGFITWPQWVRTTVPYSPLATPTPRRIQDPGRGDYQPTPWESVTRTWIE